MPANKHGLNRSIPAEVKRQVRQRDGFGCVVCGSPFVQYEHIDPEFADAHQHDPAGITLLCGGCHARKTSRMLSTDSVKAAMADPKCRQTGFSFGPLDIGQTFPEVHVGPAVAERVPVVIRVSGDDILKIEPPEEDGAPFRVSAVLSNQNGSEVLRIDENELITPITNWDVQVVGTKVTIHNAPKDVNLVLRVDPPKKVVLERLDMFHKGARLTVRENVGLTVRTSGGVEVTTTGMRFSDSRVAFDIGADGSLAMGQGGSMYIDHMVGGTNIPPHRLPPALPNQTGKVLPFVRPDAKLGRNDPCRCGSGAKYKNCCGG